MSDPDFLIIGAMRSGTASLFYYLSQHPRLLNSDRKEVHFFETHNYQRHLNKYRRHFPDKDPGELAYEATPLYLFLPGVAERIAATYPKIKLIVILRNPVRRAISHYKHACRSRSRFHRPPGSHETESVSDALLRPEVTDPNDWRYRRCSYKSRGLYREQLDRYLEVFPRQQLLILHSRELAHQPRDCLRRVFDFLEVDDYFVEDLKRRHVSAINVQVDRYIYDFLDDYFRLANENLFELVGENYGWNRRLS